MRVLVIGAAGMIGGKLCQALLKAGELNGQSISCLHLVDVVKPQLFPSDTASEGGDQSEHNTSLPATLKAPTCNIIQEQANLVDANSIDNMISSEPAIIYHLAAIVSGQAEAEFTKGYEINFDATRALFEAIRLKHHQTSYTPKLIFASSVAVFGSPLPECIDDSYQLAPLTSYGTQKAMAELLLSDYSRKGYFSGLGLRLPTICIRPGAPNLAASSFFSNILREPINGLPANLPVDESLRHWFASPRAAVSFLIHAAHLTSQQIGTKRNINLPGLSATVADQIDALKRVVGNDAANLITRKPDEAIQAIVMHWAQDFRTERAFELGFAAETSFDDIINIYIEDELLIQKSTVTSDS